MPIHTVVAVITPYNSTMNILEIIETIRIGMAGAPHMPRMPLKIEHVLLFLACDVWHVR